MSSQNDRSFTSGGQNMRQRGQELLTSAEPYLPQAREQASRLLIEYQPPIYQRLLGMRTASAVERTAITASIIAARNGTALSDAQVQAIVENTQSLVRDRAVVKWCEILACAGLAYARRGKKMRPFFYTNRYTRILGHAGRFFVYYLGVGLFIDTPMQLSANMRHTEMIKRDPRLAGLITDGSQPQIVDRRDGQLETYASSDESITKQAASAWTPQSSSVSSAQSSYQDGSSYSQRGYQQSTSYNASQPQPESSYSSPHPSTPSRTQQQSQNGWNSDPSPTFDDGASPVAPSSPNQPQYPQGSNSWARIRQQSTDRPPPNQDSNAWGSDRNGGNSSWGSSNSGPAWGSQTPESAEKAQAQKEFDSLVERERRGTDQVQSSWGKR